MHKKIGLSSLLIIIIVVSVVFVSCDEAAFKASELLIEPANAMAGETIEVTVKVTNSGASDGVYDVILKIDGEQVANELIALAGGDDKTVVLSFTAGEPGEYQVEMAGLDGTLTVIDLEEIMENALQAITEINSYHFTCLLEIEIALPEDSLSIFEDLEGLEELP